MFRRLNVAGLVLVLAASLAAGCGGKKRPPAVATGAPSGADSGRMPSEVPQPVETGPDVRAVNKQTLSGYQLTTENNLTPDWKSRRLLWPHSSRTYPPSAAWSCGSKPRTPV